MKTRATRRSGTSPVPPREAEDVERALQRSFGTEVVDDLREGTGYNPRQRVATAHRLLLTVVEAFLVGQTLSFAALRAIFVRRFGFVRPCPFQKRFKQESAVAFFRAALEHLVASVVSAAGLELKGPLGRFADVQVYDGTGQRVPRAAGSSCPPAPRVAPVRSASSATALKPGSSSTLASAPKRRRKRRSARSSSRASRAASCICSTSVSSSGACWLRPSRSEHTC